MRRLRSGRQVAAFAGLGLLLACAAHALELSPEVQQQIGIVTATVELRAPLAQIEAHGRVLDAQPLVAAAAELVAARAALAASGGELARLESLYKGDQNVSARELETARADALRDRGAVEVARARIVSGFGLAIAERDDLHAFATTLLEGRSALVRVTLPLGRTLAHAPTHAWLSGIADPEPGVSATLIGPAPAADPSLPGQGFVFLWSETPPPPGTPVRARLDLADAPPPQPFVPTSALLHDAGKVWLYVQSGPEEFARRELELGSAGDGGFSVSRGVAAGERVVTVGAQQLLSTELDGGEAD